MNFLALLAGLLLIGAYASSAEASQGHGAHVHGEAQLTLVLEANALHIELESPAMNLVGFEHKAATDEQKARLVAAEQALQAGGMLFQFTGSKCDLEQAEVASPKDEHHGHSHSHQDSHADIRANYVFKCQQPDKLASITTSLFDRFQGIEKIQAQWIIDGKQGATQLTPGKPVLSVR